MAVATSATLQKKAESRISELICQTLEEEILSVNFLAPDVVSQFPSLFSDSVIDSVTNILGENSSEALIRSLGEERLMSPEETYEGLDSVFHNGSEILKAAIREDFRVRVHRLYSVMLDTASPT